MTQSYYEDWQEALETLKEDGMAVTIFTDATTGYDDLGNDLSTDAQSFGGYGITTGYSAYYQANGIVKAGDVQLIFTSESLSDEYKAFIESIEKGAAQAFATVDGVKWRIVALSPVKPTTSQILVKFQLRR